MLVARLSPDRGAAAGPIIVADSCPGDEMDCGTGAGRDGCGRSEGVLGPVGYGPGPVGYGPDPAGYCPGCGRDPVGRGGGGWLGQVALGRATAGTTAVGGGEPANP